MTEQEYIDEFTLYVNQFDDARDTIAGYQKEITSLQLFMNDRVNRIRTMRDQWITENRKPVPILAVQVRAKRGMEEEDEP